MTGGSISGRGWEVFLFTTAFRLDLGLTQPPIKWVPGPPSLGVNRSGREANHSFYLLPRSRISGGIPPLLQYALMARCTVKEKAQGQLYFYSKKSYYK
jgi:hypothetical protein